MNIQRLIGSLVGDALGVRRKRSTAARHLLGGFGGGLSRGSWLGGGTKLLTAAALGWGAYEIYRTHKTAQPSASTTVVPDAGTPPPVPASAAVTTTVEGAGAFEAGSDPLRRVIALLIAAARCDGDLGEEEYAAILAHAKENGAEVLVREELERRPTLDEIGNGVPAGAPARELYQLAFAIVRADETVNGAERIWLARLSSALKLSPSDAAELERDMEAKIDSQKDTQR